MIFLNPLVEIARTRFAQIQAIGDQALFSDLYNKLLAFAIYFSVPVASVYLLFSQEIISALFQRGNFQTADVKIAASCLATYAWSLPFSSLFQVNGRACESFQRLFWPSFFGTIGNLIMITATYYFTSLYGYSGIPLAKVVVELFYFLPFGFVAVQLFGGRPRYNQVVKSLCAASVSAIPVVILFNVMDLGRYNGVAFSLSVLIFWIVLFSFFYGLALFVCSPRMRGEVKAMWQHRGRLV